jgi:hypothetical protein
LRKSSQSTTISKEKNKAEKKAPVVAKELLKVRLEICVKILILISIRER